VGGTCSKGSRSFKVWYYYDMVTTTYTLSSPSRWAQSSSNSLLCIATLVLQNFQQLLYWNLSTAASSSFSTIIKGVLAYLSFMVWLKLDSTDKACSPILNPKLKICEAYPCCRVYARGSIQPELGIWHRRRIEAMYC